MLDRGELSHEEITIMFNDPVSARGYPQTHYSTDLVYSIYKLFSIAQRALILRNCFSLSDNASASCK